MKSQNKHFLRNNFINSVINRRSGRSDQKYFSPIPKPNEIAPSFNIMKTKTNMRELSRFSDRPYLETPRILATNGNESSNSYLENNYSIINENSASYMRNNINSLNSVNYFNYRSNNNRRNKQRSKKKIVIFTECPKKLSDYILKNNNKKKMYQLNYIDENDLYSGRYYNNKIYRDYNSNDREYNINSQKNQRKILNFKTYTQNNNNDFSLLKKLYNDKIKKKNKYNSNIHNLNEDLYINSNSISNNVNINNYSNNDIYTNNQNNDQLKVIKIQSVWRSYFFRKYLLSSLNNFYNFVKLSNVLIPIFYNNSKPIFKQFLIKLRNPLKEKEYQNSLYKKAVIKATKTKTKVIDDLSKKSFKQLNQIAKKNINIYTKGKRKYNLPQNNCVYRKKNELTKSPQTGKEKKFNEYNFNLKTNPKNKEPEKKNDKNKNKDKDKNNDKTSININNMIKLVTKKVYLLHFPLLLYRLRILEKIKLIEIKFQRLYRLLCIKNKIMILPYFRKYRMNILSQTINNFVTEKKINKIINNSLDDKNIVSNTNRESLNNKVNIGSKYLRSKNKLNNANDNKVIINNVNLNNVTKNKDILIKNGKKLNNIINNKISNNIEKKENNLSNNVDNDKMSNNINEIINYNIDVINIENNNNYISKDNIIDNNINNKKEILSKIINKKEIKNKNKLRNYIHKWKDFSKDIYVLPKLNSNDIASIKINSYKSTALPYRKHIKVKKRKSNNLSHTKSAANNGKNGINSFQSDSGVKKMKINIVNVLTDSNEKENKILKMFSLQSKNSIESVENSNFIKKIADVTRKINRKNLIFKYFNYWNKKAKEN